MKCGFLAWHNVFVTVDYKVHMLAQINAVGGWGGWTRTSCYVKKNLSGGKQRLRPPLKVLQVVTLSDMFKLRAMEAISLAWCERSWATSSCRPDNKGGMLKNGEQQLEQWCYRKPIHVTQEYNWTRSDMYALCVHTFMTNLRLVC